ncbi:unnamed protein product [Phaeothamnion confervicola]
MECVSDAEKSDVDATVRQRKKERLRIWKRSNTDFGTLPSAQNGLALPPELDIANDAAADQGAVSDSRVSQRRSWKTPRGSRTRDATPIEVANLADVPNKTAAPCALRPAVGVPMTDRRRSGSGGSSVTSTTATPFSVASDPIAVPSDTEIAAAAPHKKLSKGKRLAKLIRGGFKRPNSPKSGGPETPRPTSAPTEGEDGSLGASEGAVAAAFDRITADVGDVTSVRSADSDLSPKRVHVQKRRRNRLGRRSRAGAAANAGAAAPTATGKAAEAAADDSPRRRNGAHGSPLRDVRAAAAAAASMDRRPRVGSTYRPHDASQPLDDSPWNSWRDGDASEFRVRTHGYKKTNLKAPSEPAFFELVAMDAFESPRKVDHVATMLSGLEGLAVGASSGHPAVPPLFIVNAQLPNEGPSFGGRQDGRTMHVVLYFRVTERLRLALQAVAAAKAAVVVAAATAAAGAATAAAGTAAGIAAAVTTEEAVATALPATGPATMPAARATAGGGGVATATTGKVPPFSNGAGEAGATAAAAGAATRAAASASEAASVAAAVAPAGAAAAEATAPAEAPSPAALQLVEWFRLAEADDDHRGRFKAWGMLANEEALGLPGFCRKFNGKPILVYGKESTTHRGPGYVEIDVCAHNFSYVGRKGLWSVQHKWPEAVVKLGFCIEGRNDDELPERILACAVLKGLDIHRVPSLRLGPDGKTLVAAATDGTGAGAGTDAGIDGGGGGGGRGGAGGAAAAAGMKAASSPQRVRSAATAVGTAVGGRARAVRRLAATIAPMAAEGGVFVLVLVLLTAVLLAYSPASEQEEAAPWLIGKLLERCGGRGP